MGNHKGLPLRVKLKNLNFKKIKYCNINKIFFEQINLPRNLNRIPIFLLTSQYSKSAFLFYLRLSAANKA